MTEMIRKWKMLIPRLGLLSLIFRKWQLIRIRMAKKRKFQNPSPRLLIHHSKLIIFHSIIPPNHRVVDDGLAEVEDLDFIGDLIGDLSSRFDQ